MLINTRPGRFGMAAIGVGVFVVGVFVVGVFVGVVDVAASAAALAGPG